MRSAADITRMAHALGGVPVLGCIAGSPSARAGIRYGDILLRANGEPTANLAAYLAARAKPADSMTVVLFRDGLEHTLVVRFGDYTATEAEVRTFVEDNDTWSMLSVASSSSGGGEDSC